MKILENTLRRVIREEIKRGIVRSVLSEGGHAFPEVNSVVPKDFLNSSIKNAFDIANLKGMKYEIVGNKSKDFFGDIDTAVDEQELRRELKLADGVDTKGLWSALESRLSSAGITFRIIPGLSQFHMLVPLVDKSRKQLSAVDPETFDETDLPGMVQLDVFVGSLKWMVDTSSGAPQRSSYKAVYRNALMGALFSSIPASPTSEEIKTAPAGVDLKKRYVINFRRGLIDRLYYEEQVMGKRGKPLAAPRVVIVRENVIEDANEISSIFLKSPVSWSKIDSYEDLMSQIMSSNFKFDKTVQKKVIEKFKESLENLKIEMPEGI